MVSLNITPVVASLRSLKWLRDFSLKKELELEFHLKVDTGMHRFGVSLEELKKVFEVLKSVPGLKLTGLMTHLACSENPQHELTLQQLKNLKKALKICHFNKIFPKYIHFANSGGIIFLPEKGDPVRPGISLFGGYPHKKAREVIKLYPVMSLKSRIVEIKRIKKGECAGYGPNFIAKRDTVLGLIPVGYGDGYLRSLSNKGFAFYRGKRVPVVGTVSMKALYLDLTDVESPQIGDEVLLLGGEKEEVPADELAALAGTISYELFCSLGKSIPREYKE